MHDYRNFCIDGRWVKPIAAKDIPVVNPATEEVIAAISGKPPTIPAATIRWESHMRKAVRLAHENSCTEC